MELDSIKTKNTISHSDISIIGGGLGGLISAIQLSKAGFSVHLFEKKEYPFHKVCGEYVSNEVLDLLISIGFNPHSFGASTITKLRISSPNGKNYFSQLQSGGFGISRFLMDNELMKIAKSNGVQIFQNTKIVALEQTEEVFELETATNEKFSTNLVIGSWGKRDALDMKLNRDFIKEKTGFLGVKYHIKTDYPLDEVGLDNFENGYCGIVKIENDLYNLCYLYKKKSGYTFNNLNELHSDVLFKNTYLKSLFLNSDFMHKQPEVINQISFANKNSVVNNILLCGDSAGLITPLCGNGMAMAISGGNLLSSIIINYVKPNHFSFKDKAVQIMMDEYQIKWNQLFSNRLFWGRRIQNVFGNTLITGTVLQLIYQIPTIQRWVVKQTHGKKIMINSEN